MQESRVVDMMAKSLAHQMCYIQLSGQAIVYMAGDESRTRLAETKNEIVLLTTSSRGRAHMENISITIKEMFGFLAGRA